MKIDINKQEQLLSHVLLQNTEVATAVAETPEWTEDGVIKATVQFNGVEVPAETLEEVLQHFVKCIEDACDFDSVQAQIKEAVRKSKAIEDESVRELEETVDTLKEILSCMKGNLQCTQPS